MFYKLVNEFAFYVDSISVAFEFILVFFSFFFKYFYVLLSILFYLS